jgi:uncharacterized membrane protein
MGGNKGRVRIVKKKAKATPRPRDKKKTTPAVVLAACYFCNKKVDEKEYLCGGCDQVVCDQCEVNPNMPWGEHDPMVHRDDE